MKYISIILAVVMILAFGLTACQAEEKKVEEQSYTVLITDINDKYVWGSDEISKEIKKRTGVNFNIEFLDTEINSKLESMISLNEFPDMILSINNDDISTLVSNNALVALDDYITEDSNIYRMFGDDLDNMRCDVDGKIYGFNRNYHAIAANSDATIFVQYEVLKYFDYPDLTDITLDDLYLMLEEYKKEFEYINNEKTIGLSFWGDSYGMNITLNNPALRTGGYQNDGKYVVDDELNVTYGLKTDEAKEFFMFLQKLNSANLLDQEGIVQDRSQFTDKISKGNVLAVTTAYWDLEDGEALLRENGMSNRCYMPIPVKLNENTDISDISRYDALGTWKSVITKTCDDPKALFEFFDTMWSEEMQVLVNWGIEGVHYDVIDGKKVIKDSIIDQAIYQADWKIKTGLTLFSFWGYGGNVKDENGEYYNYFTSNEFIKLGSDEETKKILNIYQLESFKDLCPEPKESVHTFVWKLNQDTSSAGGFAETYIDDVLRRIYLPKVIFAKTEDEFKTQWRLFMNEINRTDINLKEQEISDILKSK